MKTQILAVEPYDNLISLMDKIVNSESPRLILTAETFPDWMLDPTAIRLLARKAVDVGRQVGITSPDLGVRNLYAESGFQTFEDMTSAQHDRWKDTIPARFVPQPAANIQKPLDVPFSTGYATQSVGAKIGISILAFLTILGLLVAFIPKAVVTISLQKNSTQLAVPVEIGPQFAGVSLSGSIPARLQTFTVSNTSTLPVSSKGLVPQDFASGEVVFTNLTNIEQEIPEGIQLSTASDPPILYLTKESARLEGKSGAEVVVPVVAKEAGEAGNLVAGQITQINSILGTQIDVRNDLPITGGTSGIVSVPGPVDRNSIRAKALEEIRNRTITDAQASLLDNEILLEQSYRLVKTLTEEYYPETGKPGDTISLELAVETQVLVLKSDDLADYFNQVTGLGIANDEKSIPVDGKSVQLSCKSSGVLDQFSCVITGTKQTYRSLSEDEVRSKIWGRNQDQVRKILAGAYPQIGEVKIDQNPSGWPWLPFVPNRMKLEIH